MATSHGGAKIGTRIAHVVSKAIVATHGKLVGTKHKLAMLIFHSISDMISSEVHVSLDPMLVKVYEELPEGSLARPLLGFMANEVGQLQAGAGISMVAGSILGSISAIINNELMPSVRGILETNPHMLPDPGTIAQMASKGLSSNQNAVAGINQQGIDSGWANAMITMNYQYPDPGTANQMRNRGIIDLDTFNQWAQLNGYNGEVQAHLGQMASTPLSPADAALAVLRGSMPMQEAVDIAAQSGVTETDFNTMIDNTGEPLGLMQLLEAFRRGFIDEDTLKQGILQSRVRDEWIDTAVQLRYSPMSVADAVNAVVQGHMTPDDAATIAEQNGLTPGAVDILEQTAGEPLSRTEMEDLYNRGEVTKAEVLQALSESRLKNKYNEQAFALHSKLMDIGALSDAVFYGAMTEQDATDRAMQIGYDQTTAAILVSSAVNRKLQDERQQTLNSIVSMYESNAISLVDATALAGSIGFEKNQATFIFQAAEFRRNQKLVAAAMSAVRSKYIGHHITENQAQAYIDALGVPAGERDQVIQTWTIEREANVAILTEAQIVKAVGNQLITEQDGLDRLVARGYTEVDANLLINGA